MKKYILLLSFVLSFVLVFGQTVQHTYYTPFKTTDQNMWQAGTTGIIEIDHPFFDKKWGPTSGSFGSVKDVAGYDFGALVNTRSWSEIGMGFKVNFGTEKLSIDYNSNMFVVAPSDLTFNGGDRITLNTSFQPLSSSDIVTDTYNADMSLYMRFGIGLTLDTKVCVFSCTEKNIVDLNLPTDDYDIVKISSADGISVLAGLYTWPTSEAFPFHFEDSEGIITLDVTLPDNSDANVYLSGNELHSYSDPSDPYFNVYFSIPKFIGALHIPNVSAVFANLSNSFEAGPFYLDYTILESGFNLGLYHKSHLILSPTMKGTFSLPTAVDYKVVNPSNGAVISQGTDSIINYTVGDDVQIEYPCNYDFMDVTPSYEMENTFRNHTYDSIALDFVFQMLEFNMGMSEVTVIPEICADVPYPCPTWDDPLKWCSEYICTPAVVYDGFNIGVGPLVDWQPNLYNVKYDWVDNSWEMQGFNSLNDMTPFRLEPRKFDVQMTVTPVACYDKASGSATAIVTNGSPPYTYEWSNGEVVTTYSTTNTQNNLTAGTHYVIVHDAGECTVFDSKVIVQPDEPLAYDYTVSNPECFNYQNGSVELNVSGGTPGYTYSWNTGASSSSLSNLDTGLYVVTISDSHNCEVKDSFKITQPDEIIAEISSQNILCKGDDNGYISLDVSGGVAPYQYSWSNGNTTNADSNLLGGVYDITVTDYNSCPKNISVELTEPDNILAVQNIVEDNPCYGDSLGSIAAIPTGGTKPYHYTWSNADNEIINQTDSVLINLVEGKYTLFLTDSNNCDIVKTIEVAQPDSLSYQIIVKDALCKDEPGGSINLVLSGGTLPYTYLWSNGATSDSATNLVSGDYSVVVTDSNYCEYNLSAYVGQPSQAFTVETEISDVKCYGESTGKIVATPAGGTAPYSITWSTGATGEVLENVSAGSYTLSALDSNKCSYYSGGVVSQPDTALLVNSVVNSVSCFGYTDGSVIVDIVGGTLPYKFYWDDDVYILSSNQQKLNGLKTGVYNIKVEDDNNCSVDKRFFIDSPDSVQIDITSTKVSCFDGSDGKLFASITGGTKPYTYLWSNGNTEQNLINVQAGSYTLEITDSNKCVYEAFAEISSFPEIIVTSEISNPSCKDIEDGSIKLTVVGGVGVYSYLWSNGKKTQKIDSLAAGSYDVIIKDTNNCSVTLYLDVLESYNECLFIPNTFSPNGDNINDYWDIKAIEEYPDASIQVFNKWGSLVFSSTGTYTMWDGTYNSKQLPSGTYYYIINLNNGDSPYTGTVTIVK